VRKRPDDDKDLIGLPLPKINKVSKPEFFARFKSCRAPNNGLSATGATIEAVQLHNPDFVMDTSIAVHDISVIPNEVPQAGAVQPPKVKRVPQLDWEPKTKVIKKVKFDTNTLLVPKLSTKLQAKFDHLPIAGGRIGIQTGVVTPFSTHPLAQIRESPASSSRDTVVAALVASATAEVSLPEPRTSVKRPLDEDPG